MQPLTIYLNEGSFEDYIIPGPTANWAIHYDFKFIECPQNINDPFLVPPDQFEAVEVHTGKRRAFCIYSSGFDGSELYLKTGAILGVVYVSNSDLEILGGQSLQNNLYQGFVNMAFNGSVRYYLHTTPSESPSISIMPAVSDKPSLSPTLDKHACFDYPLWIEECEYFKENYLERCDSEGETVGLQGHTANTACCICGGGITPSQELDPFV